MATRPLGYAAILDWIRPALPVQRDHGIGLHRGFPAASKAGLLRTRLAATTSWEDIAALRAAAPNAEVRDDVPFVEQGKVITSSGISAGIDRSLHIVGRLAGASLAERTARQREYKVQA